MSQNLPLPPHRIRLPDVTGHFEGLPEKDRAYLHELVAALQRETDARRQNSTAQTHLLLLDASGAAWRVTISTAGVLSAVPFRTGGAVA